jgi:hypothetical protein
MRFEVLHEKNDYALIVRGINLDEYAVVYKLDKEKGCWANTCLYYNFSKYSSLSQPEALMYALDMFLSKTEENFISRNRFEELATLFKDRLLEEEVEEEFFEQECYMEEHEKEFFELNEERCPCCNGKLEQETYYDDVLEDTSYYNYCTKCDWNDYPEYLKEESEWHDTCEAPKTQITCENCCYFYKDCDEDGSEEDEYPRCHYPYDDKDAPCNW